jgi:hypothetical protein
LIAENFPIFFALFFATVWLTVSTVVGLLSGWFRLMARYPDQAAEPTVRLRGQSGMMGWGAGMRGILTLSVCPSGLRVGMMRVFGPFCRDFFVPWQDIAVTRKTVVVWPTAELRFGTPVVGKLRLSAHLADRLARAAGGRWPEAGSFPRETRADIIRSLLTQWVVVSAVAALFFALVPLAMAGSGTGPLVFVAALAPAVLFGLACIVSYINRR